MQIGFKLATENRSGPELITEARRAEAAGFRFGFISDHYHPWTDVQGESPFVWGVIGAIAEATSDLRVVTGVTCPTMRIHPAIVAQAAATSATLLPGRFALGVGSGENLNEHVLGDRWPPTAVRHDMLEEAVAVIRRLWQGGQVSHHGSHYTVEQARLYSLPEESPPLYVAAAGPAASRLAARIGDGLVAGGPGPEVIGIFSEEGGQGPVHTEVAVCYAPDEEEARRLAHASWPNAALAGELGQELPTPAHFEQAVSMLDVDDVAEAVTCGPDPERHAAAIREHLDAGATSVAVHQVAPGIEGFWDFYADEVLPRLSR